MPRVTHVKKARKDQGRCTSCRTEIAAGESYKWASLKTGPRSSMRRAWCDNCSPKASQLTTSKMSGIYGAQEGFSEYVAKLSIPETYDEAETSKGDIESALETAAEEIRGVGEEYQESADAIEQGFEHATYQSEELAEKAQEIESWADEIEQASIEDVPEQADDTSDDDYLNELSDWFDNARSAAEDVVNECPV